MSLRSKFILALAGTYVLLLGIVFIVGAAVWSDMNVSEREALRMIIAPRSGLLIVALFLLPFILGYTLNVFFNLYVRPVRRLAQGIGVLLSANPNHRVMAEGAAEARELAQLINQLADERDATEQGISQTVAEAKADLVEDRNRLAALMSQLTQSVIVCNKDGRILLYNHSARLLLSESKGPTTDRRFAHFGLGRSIFASIERDAIAHSLDNLQVMLERGDARPFTTFVTSLRGGQFARVQMAPVVDGESDASALENIQKKMSGFVLILDDITRRIESGARREAALQVLTEGTRAALANIRAAGETLLDYADIARPEQQTFIKIISEEAKELSRRLDHSVVDYRDSLESEWPLEEISARDLLDVIQRRIESDVDVRVDVEHTAERIWLKVDSYSLAKAIVDLARHLLEDLRVARITLRLVPVERFCYLDLCWTPAPSKVVSPENLRTWERLPLTASGGSALATLKDVLERHGSEIWSRSDETIAYIRLAMPVIEEGEKTLAVSADAVSPPMSLFDFRILDQSDLPSELVERKLSELTYTVFDTETTGMRPNDGDEILSIGAVRIVNGKLLHNEVFDQLVNPMRKVPSLSTHIHGITDEMLIDQPKIERVLPVFYKFCEDTVLVGHNAAFDLTFFRLKEQSTGVRFTSPVLDTLLLSAAVLEDFSSHQLEVLAQRFGVNVIGRHTALGDALLTAEIFLRMIPLLGEHGIVTLRQALDASQKTQYGRLAY